MKKTYAVSDLHGCLDLYNQIKEFINPEDTVYCLGDCGDRGPHPWETIKAVYEDPQFIYLMGNHEHMLVQAIDAWLPEHLYGFEYACLQSNGGAKTFSQWKRGAERNKWRNKLAGLPFQATYLNTSGIRVELSHAGFTVREGHVPKKRDLMWDRSHFYDPWHDQPNTVVVHGHTPTPHMRGAYDLETLQKDPDHLCAAWYCEHHKVCIDLGAVFLGCTVLLDLDTFEEHYFFTEVEKK